MICWFCGAACVKICVSTQFEAPDAAVVWECSACKRIQAPPKPRRISADVWEQIRQHSEQLKAAGLDYCRLHPSARFISRRYRGGSYSICAGCKAEESRDLT